jgi:hypothetical protein
MQYHNPFRLFNISSAATDKAAISVLEQRIDKEYAAFGLQETVTYNGTRLKLEELKRCLHELQDPKLETFHLELLKKTELLNFLEYGHLGYFQNNSEHIEDSGMMEFIAPYFAYQYSEALIQALKVQDSETIALLVNQNLPLSEANENLYFYDTAFYLNDSLKDLEKLKEDPRLFVMSERELALQLPDKVIESYNVLPAYFNELRDSIGLTVRQLAENITIQGGRREGAIVLIKQVLKLNLSNELSKELQSLLKQLNPGLGRVPLFLIIGTGIILLLFLLKWLETNFFQTS